MKRIIILVMLIFILTFTSCNNKENIISNTDKNNLNNNLVENKNLESNENKEEIKKSDEMKNNLPNLIKNLDTLIFNNLNIQLSQEENKELIKLMDINKWTSTCLPNCGYESYFKLRNDSGKILDFLYPNFIIYFSNNNKYCYFISPEDKDNLSNRYNYILELANLSISNGNNQLINHIKQFDQIVVGDITEIDNLYNIPKENIIKLTQKQQKNLHNILNINKWKFYLGDIGLCYHLDLKDIPFILKLNTNEDESVYLLTGIYNDKYILDVWGGGMGYPNYTFEITKDIYNNLCTFKKNISLN